MNCRFPSPVVRLRFSKLQLFFLLFNNLTIYFHGSDKINNEQSINFEDDFPSKANTFLLTRESRQSQSEWQRLKATHAWSENCKFSWSAGVIKIMLMKAFCRAFLIHFNENDMQQQYSCRRKPSDKKNVSLDIFFLLDHWGINYVGEIFTFSCIIRDKIFPSLQLTILWGRICCEQVSNRLSRKGSGKILSKRVLSQIKSSEFLLIASYFSNQRCSINHKVSFHVLITLNGRQNNSNLRQIDTN